MSTKQRLIQEIGQAPEELIEELLDFLLFSQARKNQDREIKLSRPYALCKGEFIVPPNFDDFLPKEILQAFENPQ